MSSARTLVLPVLATLAAAPVLAAVPAGFVDEVVTSVSAPTDVAFTPDGRLLVASQGGTLHLYAPPAYSSATVALTFAANTLCSNSERGLLGIAVDPSFPTNGYVYLFYTAQKPGTTGCPTGSSNVFNRVSRFTFSPSSASTIDPASQVVLIDNIPSPNGNHNAGDLAFGKDGFLYVTTGEGGVPSAARDESFLGGKVLRIDPKGATPAARIPDDNPYAQDPSAEPCAVAGRTTTAGKTRCKETFAWGFRNPFRFAFDPGAVQTRFFINDVGQSTWEEIDLAQPGADYGWNVREGFCANGSTTNCGAPPAGMTNPIYAYQHGVQVPGTSSPTNCDSITGGAFVPAGSWPTGYDASYLFADYVCGWIFRRLPGGAVQDFATNLGGSSATSLTFGTVGAGTAQALYYTTYAGGGQVRRIRYTSAANRAPVAALTADPTSGSAPLAVSFDASGSSDPDGDLSLTYVWSFGDGSAVVETASPTTMHTFGLGSFTASVRVRDSLNALSDPATVAIDAGNTPPVPSITSPSSSLLFHVGQAITLSGEATDVEDGALPASALSWTVVLHHNDHTHPFLGPVSGNDIPLTAPPPEDLDATAGSYLEVRLTATDSLGASTTVTMNLQPNRVSLSFETSPSGLHVEVNGTDVVAPRTLVSWEAWGLDVSAPDQEDTGGSGWEFTSWSDAGAQRHTIVTPATPATYTASFVSGPVLSVENAGAASFVPTSISAVFRVRRSSPTGQTAMVDYATTDGTATAGTDYTATAGTLSFPPGSTLQTVAVPVTPDFTPAANRTFFLDLSNPQNAGIADGRGTGRIVKGPLPEDLDGNGKPDILWRNTSTRQLYVWLMDGTIQSSGAFLTAPTVADTRWQIRGLGDFDGDGKPDILWQHQSTGQLYVWLMDGVSLSSGTFLTPPAVSDTRWQIRGVGDFNGDGKPDILWQRQSTGQLYVWFMNGTAQSSGTFLTPPAVADPAWVIRGLDDFDRDGKPDILWQHQSTGQLYVWFMNGTAQSSGTFLTPPAVPDTRWKISQVGDLDGDGKPDILWRNQSTGQLYAWFMDVATQTSGTFLTPSAVANLSWQINPQ
jgi:glucose/arabinose dehydrogenase